MNLLEMLAKPASTKPVGVIDRILDSLPEAEADRVRQVLADRIFPASQIVAALASAGHTVSETTVRAYRRQRETERNSLGSVRAARQMEQA